MTDLFLDSDPLVYYERCPVCNSELKIISFMKDGEETLNFPSYSRITRICNLNPARRNIINSHKMKSHFFEEYEDMLDWTNQIQYFRKPETHESKYLLLLHYKKIKFPTLGRARAFLPGLRQNDVSDFRTITFINIKNDIQISINGIWKPSLSLLFGLSVNNYRNVYKKAQSLLVMK